MISGKKNDRKDYPKSQWRFSWDALDSKLNGNTKQDGKQLRQQLRLATWRTSSFRSLTKRAETPNENCLVASLQSYWEMEVFIELVNIKFRWMSFSASQNARYFWGLFRTFTNNTPRNRKDKWWTAGLEFSKWNKHMNLRNEIFRHCENEIQESGNCYWNRSIPGG